MPHLLLVINTGSTSTKISLFEDETCMWNDEITAVITPHTRSMQEQCEERKQTINRAVMEKNLCLQSLSAIAARGGTFGLVHGGAYRINQKMVDACWNPITNHASNLSAIVAWELAQKIGCNAYIYDAVCTNEVQPIARITGLHDVLRRPFSHVLNTRAAARRVAEKLGRTYERCNFIVAHLGGGISINVHVQGKIIDVVTDDDGPMSPERAGKLNGKSYVDMCYGTLNKRDVMFRIKGNGGLMDHFGTSDLREVERRAAAGDQRADLVIDAMAYQIAKDIGALSTVALGKIDRIILTGGMAHSQSFIDRIASRVEYIAPIEVLPGEHEQEALAAGVLRVLRGEECAAVYQ